MSFLPIVLHAAVRLLSFLAAILWSKNEKPGTPYTAVITA